jgi:hypothetical protein
VSARQNGGEDSLHDLLLAHDALGHLGPKAGDRAHQPMELLDVVGRGGVSGGGHGLS